MAVTAQTQASEGKDFATVTYSKTHHNIGGGVVCSTLNAARGLCLQLRHKDWSHRVGGSLTNERRPIGALTELYVEAIHHIDTEYLGTGLACSG
jgi:hypothetical protein